MSNDKTTLADVQPGGRVRLGDQPWPEIDAILADAYSAGATGLPFEGIARRHAVRAAVAALSAQPSPGGQGDALTILAKHMRRIAAAHNVPDLAADAKIVESGYELDFWMDAAYCALLEALAARQPVGSVPQGCDACDRTGICQNDDGRNVFCPNCDLGRACAGDTRQPLGQISDAEIDARLNALYREMVDSGQHNGGMSGVAWARAVYRMVASQPAQAVDLGQFRTQVAELLCREFDLEVADPEDHRHDDGSGEANQIASNIAALIDGKAVGDE